MWKDMDCDNSIEEQMKKEWSDLEQKENMPVLTGSFDQIQEARKLRFYAILGLQNAPVAVSNEIRSECVSYYKMKDSASWWIAHKNTTFRRLFEDFIENVYLLDHPEFRKK